MRVVVRDGELRVEARTASIRGRQVRLTAREWALVAYLAAHAGRAVSREELLREVWGYSSRAETRTVETTVARLRAKIERRPDEPEHLVTVYGFGYRLDADTGADEALVGREGALDALRALAQRHARVALIGPPGVGKSRLAAAWAAEAGARTVALGAAQDEDDLAVLLAGADGADPLVLDDVDRVMGPARAWVDAQPAARRIVLTARERPGTRGEAVSRLDGLAPADAVALLERCLRRMGAPEASRVLAEQLVARLDGLPLAIEYLAGRALVLPPAELLQAGATHLGSPEADPRRRTIGQAIRWTWDRLARWEQTALSELAVFEGGFTLAAARAVLTVPAGEALDVLQALVDKSFVRRSAPGRWEVYGIFREFTGERLTLHPHRASALERFADWAVATAGGALGAPDGAERVAAEAVNLRAAYEWCAASRPEDARQVAAALGLHLSRVAPEAWERLRADADAIG